MFTIKYRQFIPSAKQNGEGPTFYDKTEQISGPYEFVSQEQSGDGFTVIHAHREGGAPGCTFGPIPQLRGDTPRPTLWVMNENGSTVAKYDL